MLTLTTAFLCWFGGVAIAQPYGTKTVAAIKADRAKTLDQINKGEGGFLNRDLYPFCGNVSDGRSIAIGNPNAEQLIGTDARTLKDSTGKAFGEEIFAARSLTTARRVPKNPPPGWTAVGRATPSLHQTAPGA